MNHWIDEQTGCKMCEPDCADEWLFDIWAIGCDYDGASTVEDFRSLVKEIVYCSQKARDCHKCVYEVGCHGNPVGCKRYKRDTPDGGYYG